MASCTIEEARAAQAAAHPCTQRTSQTHSANVATTVISSSSSSSTSTPSTVTINGVTYSIAPVIPSSTTSSAAPTTTSAQIEEVSLDSGDNWEALVALDDDDDMNSLLVRPNGSFTVSAFTASMADVISYPFLLDTGAMCHISLVRSDFSSFVSIPSCLIKGLRGACIYAVGMGLINIPIAPGCVLTLHDALFIPSSCVCLISVLMLCCHNSLTCHFNSDSCWLTDVWGSTVACGAVVVFHLLYSLSLVPELSEHSAFPSVYAPTSDIETWHCCLGHCNLRTLIDMACAGVVSRMQIDLSSLPPKCNVCILGKQTKTPVPKLREGNWSTVCLHKVYIDLSGPYSVASCFGHKYYMNIIDEFFSFAWCIPIATKDDALMVLQVWHHSVEKQSRAQLKIFLTDNGELISNACHAWCDAHGIVHQCTGPYTSIQNGCVEHLHHTLLHKACIMWIACDAPLDLWHEFCLTAAYLTNHTASDTFGGHMPHELWFGKKPSLSHLCEIGCSAYSLLHKYPKVFTCSISMILISYTLNSHSYCLWDCETDCVFDLYHVVFIEHLNSKPHVFHPSQIIPAISSSHPSSSSPQTPLYPPLPIPTQITTELPPLPSISLQLPAQPVFHP
jgi:Integrase core domain/GAG-pre-integrase domain